MPSLQQLLIWRRQAADRLQALIMQNAGADYQPGDYKVDDLLRSLANLPARPVDRQPYKGSFPNDAADTGRKKAANRLKQIIVSISNHDFQPQDGMVDHAIRLLTNLPVRPNHQPPYAALFAEAKVPNITTAQIIDIASYADPVRVDELLPYILLTMVEYAINTPLRQAHFLAQLAHESGSFNYVEELASGEDYEDYDDLGNTEPGDGVRFKGRGLIQITGRTNYTDCGADLGVDLVKNPTRLADNDLACLSAGWFWAKNNLNTYADQDDVEMVTKIINGGYNGFEERQYFLSMAREVLLA
jgi:putative chitinase